MGKVFDFIDEPLRTFIEAQRMFFIGTAPLSQDGHINLSPKGHDTLRVIDELTLAYLDLTGSGAETIAHVRENGRVVVMFCAFDGPPNIVRIHGQGEVLLPDHDDFGELRALFGEFLGVRSIIRIRAERVADACGYAVPLFEYLGERDQLRKFTESKGPQGLVEYRREKNAVSIDGLPGVDPEPPTD